MQKFAFLALFFLVFVLTAPVLADDKMPEYDPNMTYAGLYKTDHLYQLNKRNNTWYGNKRPGQIQNLKCLQARSALRQGTWTGNLSSDGECLGSAEAPTLATGNYLNYSSQQQLSRD